MNRFEDKRVLVTGGAGGFGAAIARAFAAEGARVLVAPLDLADTASIESAADFLQHRLIQISTHRINWNQILQSATIDSIPTRQLCFTENTPMALALVADGRVRTHLFHDERSASFA